MKRFYKNASAQAVEGGFAVALDAKTLLTPPSCRSSCRVAP